MRRFHILLTSFAVVFLVNSTISSADWNGASSLTYEIVDQDPPQSNPPSAEDPTARYGITGSEATVWADTQGYPGEAHVEVIFTREYTWSGGGTPTAAIVRIDGLITGWVNGTEGLGTATSSIITVGLSALVHAHHDYRHFDFDYHTLSSTDRFVRFRAYAYVSGVSGAQFAYAASWGSIYPTQPTP